MAKMSIRSRPRGRKLLIATVGVLAVAGVAVGAVGYAGAGSDRAPEEARALSRLDAAGAKDPQVKALAEWLHDDGAETSTRSLAASDAGVGAGSDASASARALAPSGPDLARAAVLQQQITDSSAALATLWSPNEAAYQSASESVREQMIVDFVTRNTAQLNRLRADLTADRAELDRITNGG